MKRFVKIMALFALFLLTLAIFDKLQAGIMTGKPGSTLTGFAVYETRQLTWLFDTTNDFSFDSSLVNISSGEAKLKVTNTITDSTDSPALKLPKGNNSELSITNISDSKYTIGMLKVGDKYYVDKDEKITALPVELQGMLWLKTQNADKNIKKNITFATNRPARIFIGYDKGAATAPDWMQSWTYWGTGITTEDDGSSPFKIYYKDFPAGSILLGSNNKSNSMYVILVNNTGYASKYEYTPAAAQYTGSIKTISVSADKPDGTTAKVQARIAQTQQGLDSAQWLGPTTASDYYTTTAEKANAAYGSGGGWHQYKATLETTKPENTPTLSSVKITAEKTAYPSSATVTTKDYAFEKAVEMQKITADESLNGQTTAYAYSTDSGSSWTAVTLNSSISVKTSKVMARATLNSNTAQTPAVKSVAISYKISICDEKWRLNYTSCAKNDTRIKYYTDANSCGSTEDLPAGNGTAESCDYCTPSWTETNGTCTKDDKITATYLDANSCYTITGLASDNNKPANKTYTCDYCTPQWTNLNGSCKNDDTLAVTYAYANTCCKDTGLTSDCTIPNNSTAACDYCTPSFTCSSYSDCNENNQKTCLSASDTKSCYSQTRLASDNYSGSYSEFTASCAYDSEAPLVNDVTSTSANSIITITANVTDKSATTITAQLIRDGAAVRNLTLANTAKDTYSATASTEGLNGAYIIRIIAKDKYNNTARTKGIAGISTDAEKTTVTDVVFNASRKALMKITNTTKIELNGKTAQGTLGKLVAAEHENDTRNSTKPQAKKELRKYLEIEADEELKANISSATLTINYSDAEVASSDISESSLAIFFYNETELLWQQLNSTVNKELNYVEGNATHLSFFGVFGNEQNQTANATINATINSTTNSTINATINATVNATTNATLTNATNSTANATQNTPAQATQPSQASTEAAPAGGSGGGGGAAEKRQAEKKAEAEPAVNATEAANCSYEVKVELVDKPSFINTTRANGTLNNIGTCALQGVEIKLTKPLDTYISVENGNAAELGPAESLAFALKLKAAAPAGEAQQKQPLQGLVVKEPRKKAVYNGKIIITGNAVKGLGLDIEATGPKLEKEVPMNIEIYELEQKGRKNVIAPAIIAAFILLGALGMGYSAITKKRNQSRDRKNGGGNNDGDTAKLSENNAAKVVGEHEKETLNFEEKQKAVAEKWKQQRESIPSEEDKSSGKTKE